MKLSLLFCALFKNKIKPENPIIDKIIKYAGAKAKDDKAPKKKLIK